MAVASTAACSDPAAEADTPSAGDGTAVGLSMGVDAADTGTIRLHYIEHAIGSERYEVGPSEDGVTFTDDFEFLDRGGRVRLETEARFSRDLTPRTFQSSGTTYRFIHVASRVSVHGDRATVLGGGDSAVVDVPAHAFVGTGYAPLALQGLLVRRWEILGRPDELSLLPGDPAHTVRVSFRGSDTVATGDGRPVPLRRYAVEGAVWGREAVWLEPDGRFGALRTSAPFLPFEGVREDLAGSLPVLQRAALADRMQDLARWRQELEPVAEGRYALVGARIVDGTGSPPVEDGTLVVEGDRIAAVGPSSEVTIPDGAVRVDARGTTVVPGLWEMHAHVAQIEWAPAYLAAGVTTVRDMGGEALFLTAFRDAVDAGRATGPTLHLAGLVDGPGPGAFGAVTASTPAEGREMVERYHAAGFRQMKLYTLLAREVIDAITARAHELGMTVTGHVPAALTLEEAVDAGMDHIAHLPISGEPSDTAVARRIRLLAERGVVVDATLSWGELLGRPEGVRIADFEPGFASAPWPLRAAFASVPPAGARSQVAARQARRLRLVKAMHDAGVTLVTGTDGAVPGHSLHREIELFAKAGLTPMEALRAATAVPAEVLGLAHEVGTLRPGLRADLLVLESNPLQDVSAVREGRWVVARGRMFETDVLWRQAGFR